MSILKINKDLDVETEEVVEGQIRMDIETGVIVLVIRVEDNVDEKERFKTVILNGEFMEGQLFSLNEPIAVSGLDIESEFPVLLDAEMNIRGATQ